MNVFSYLTVDKPASGIYKEKGSKFLSFVYPVENEEQIKQQLAALRKEYYDARHHCFAWILGPEKKHYRAFDDGEPNHSAGDPILGQIRSRNLTNVLVVVVRYFGGTKLGVGGLVAAYKLSAEDALNKCIAIEKEVTEELTLHFDYSATAEVMRVIKEFDLHIEDQQFNDGCMMRLNIPLKRKEKLMEKINLMIAMGVGLKTDQ